MRPYLRKFSHYLEFNMQYSKNFNVTFSTRINPTFDIYHFKVQWLQNVAPELIFHIQSKFLCLL